MKTAVKITVVIPIYNREAFLAEAVESVLNQDFQDFELLLIDDGSTDGSAQLAQDYARVDKRVQLLQQENAGVSAARNRGLQHAQGCYIYFLDSDDTLDSTFLSSSYQVLEQEQADGLVIGADYGHRFPQLVALPTCAQMWRLSYLQRHADVRFPLGIQPAEDGLFSHCLLAMSDRIAYNPAGIYHYRSHEDQNHRRIAQEADRLLAQIPDWFNYLVSFYERNSLLGSKSLHLARFLEHEPFGFRYLNMSLQAQQKQDVMDMIQAFYQQYSRPYISQHEFKQLSVPFQEFLHSPSVVAFDQFYSRYQQKRQQQLKWGLFCSRFIPISRVRRKMRAYYREEQSR